MRVSIPISRMFLEALEYENWILPDELAKRLKDAGIDHDGTCHSAARLMLADIEKKKAGGTKHDR
jgi:hypothetical protein